MINPKDDQLCASIISNVINRGEGQSRTASSPAPIIRNQAYALRQKLFRDFVPSSPASESESESRAASIITQGTKSRNQAYELRRILFGLN